MENHEIAFENVVSITDGTYVSAHSRIYGTLCFERINIMDK